MNKKGFTLIEVLIVVVIVGILAAMVVPRFLSQPEKAVLAEATQMLGALKRAQIQTMDLGVGTTWQAITDVTDDTEMQTIGMRGVPESNFFTYACDADANTCTATRIGNTDSTITISMNNAALTCAGDYVADATTGGCRHGSV